MKEIESYNNACNDLLKAFCKKHEFDYEEAKESWVGDDIGGIVCCGDYFFNMSDIVTDLRENAPKEKLIEWYDYTLECNYLGARVCNYASFLRGCPTHSEKYLQELRRCKRRAEEAERMLKECLKNDDLMF